MGSRKAANVVSELRLRTPTESVAADFRLDRPLSELGTRPVPLAPPRLAHSSRPGFKLQSARQSRLQNRVAIALLYAPVLIALGGISRLDHWLADIAIQAQVAAALVSLLVSVLLVVTMRWHGRFTLDSFEGVQKFHTNPTPRIGGIGILLGLTVGWYVLDRSSATAAREIAQLLAPMLLASIPACAFGLLEDTTKRVTVGARLLATIVSGVFACLLTGFSLSHVNVWGLDFVLSWLPLSIIFTGVAVAGIANAVNIIDGFNGLASGSLIISFAALAMIALRVGDNSLAALALLVPAAIAGFALLNFPFGKIFLGDGGAYAAGFMLAWVAVLLPTRNPGCSPWASLLACGYPVIEVAFSVWRKHHREGHRPGEPDRLHFHMLIHNRFARRVFPLASSSTRNSLTSLFLWVYASLPALVAVLYFRNTAWLVAGFLLSMVVYRLAYCRLSQFRWRLGSTMSNPRRMT